MYLLTRRRAIATAAGAGILGLPLVCAGCGSKTESKLGSGSLVIIYTNDIHGYVAPSDECVGLAAVAGLKEKYEADGATVLLVDAGDAVQGSSLIYGTEGACAVGLMNFAGYDVAVPGNHEFDWGEDHFKELVAQAEFPYICSNIVDEATGKTLLDAQYVIDKGGLKVGFFGLTTPATVDGLEPEDTEGLEFLSNQDLLDAAQNQSDDLRVQGCDYVICLSHLGNEDSAGDNTSESVLNNVTGIDLLIDGHDHQLVNKTIDGTLLVETGSHLETVGVAVFNDAGVISDVCYKPGTISQEDEKVAEVVAVLVTNAQSDVIGVSEVDLIGDTEIIRTSETNLGDFVCDAFLWSAEEYVGGALDCCLLNAGGMKKTLAKGDLFEGNLQEVMPYGGTICVVELMGIDILESIAHGAQEIMDINGSFLQVSGMSFTLHTQEDSSDPSAYVTIHDINGRGFNENDLYTVVISDYMAGGGDDFDLIAVRFEENGRNTDLKDIASLESFISNNLNGVVDAKTYGQAAGRIEIL